MSMSFGSTGAAGASLEYRRTRAPAPSRISSGRRGAVEVLERDGPGDGGREVVVEDRAVGRVRHRRLVGGGRRVGVRVPPDARRDPGPGEDGRRGGRGVDLPERRDVVEDPEAASVRGGDEVVVFDRQIAYG